MLKINLHCGQMIRSDFYNYDIRKKFNENQNGVLFCNSYKDLAIADESVDEILVNEGCIETLPMGEVVNTYKYWYRLLKDDGKIKIYFIDSRTFATMYLYHRINHENFNNIIQQCNRMFECDEVVANLESANYKIDTINIENRLGIIHANK